jgi:hypothetical protein
MLRITATRSLLKGFVNVPSIRSSYSVAVAASKSNVSSEIRVLSAKRPRTAAPTTFHSAAITLLRYATTARPPVDKIDREAERRNLEKKLEPQPDAVTGTSSVRLIFAEGQAKKADEDDTDILRGIKSDIVRLPCDLRSKVQ